MSSCNDWAPLKEIIGGTAKTYNTPKLSRSFHKTQFPEYNEEDIPVGPYPDWVIEEAEEDLNIFADTLEALGVVVHRPDISYAEETNNWHYYSPRDCTLIVGNKIIETPSPNINRRYETWGYRNIFESLHERGYEWIKAPTPILFDESFEEDTRGVPSLRNNEILFEAANCVRVNGNILFQISNTGNEKGAQWLQDVLKNHKIHLCENLYSYAHLDSTIIPLREGLVMYNASRVNEENEPKIFKSWDKIWIDECHSSAQKTNLPWGASEWIGMNLLSVNPNLVIMDWKQTHIINELLKHKIEVIPLELRHDRLLAGGFHCVTLDLVR